MSDEIGAIRALRPRMNTLPPDGRTLSEDDEPDPALADPSLRPNPGDPGPEIPVLKRRGDPLRDPALPPEEPPPRGY